MPRRGRLKAPTTKSKRRRCEQRAKPTLFRAYGKALRGVWWKHLRRSLQAVGSPFWWQPWSFLDISRHMKKFAVHAMSLAVARTLEPPTRWEGCHSPIIHQRFSDRNLGTRRVNTFVSLAALAMELTAILANPPVLPVKASVFNAFIPTTL